LPLLFAAACTNTTPSGRDAGEGDSDAGSAQCGAPFDVRSPAATEDVGLRINEVLASNDGAAVDEQGETEDFIELLNSGDAPLALGDFSIADADHHVRLPVRTLAPGEHFVLWADDTPAQGDNHLPFKLEREGEPVSLWRDGCTLLDALIVPALEPNQTFARFPDGANDAVRCRYASPGRANAERCAPPAPHGVEDQVHFAAYTWPAAWPKSQSDLVITELALGPQGFVELGNAGDHEVSLSGLALRIAALAPGSHWPDAGQGAALPLSASSLAPGARTSVAFPASLVASLLTDATREGAVSLFGTDGAPIDRLDFMSLPDGASLARELRGARLYKLCGNPSPGRDGACMPLSERPVGDRLRALNGDGDFAALARGGTEVGTSAVKFIVDMQADDTVYLLGNERWALHYTFIREQIDRQTALNRCDPFDNALFNQGWWDFSVREYFRVEGRRYLLGTLVKNANGLYTIEFAVGDAIVAEQMKRAFFAVVQHTPDPTRWALRPQDDQQLLEMTKLNGQLPIVGTNAPFRDLIYQPLTRGVGFGTLRFVPADELASATLGPQVIVITDDVPNDIQLVGGLITEAFQAPLAHVNVLSEARGTPNMALRDAHKNPRIAPLLDKLVRLEAGPSDFDVREASPEEAAAFFAERMPAGPRLRPVSDESLRGIQKLSDHDLYSAQRIGSKAAQLAELSKVSFADHNCPASTVPLTLPSPAMAIPFVHYAEHFVASGASDKLEALLADPAFAVDAGLRARGLAELRELIAQQPIEASFLAELVTVLNARYGEAVVRFRSSSNVEDLDTFNGAGLHTSTSAALGKSAERNIADALHVVWASLWNERAYEERELGHLEQRAARMAVLIHERFEGEAAQGVAISRNLFDLTRSDIYYVNAQRGEASVTNPAPGVATEQLLYTWAPRTPELGYQSYSSLNDDKPVLSLDEVRGVVCALSAIHSHFLTRIAPDPRIPFAMQIEWKLEHGTRRLFVKQARPQPFADTLLPKDCRNL
jgi:hypothetical protein